MGFFNATRQPLLRSIVENGLHSGDRDSRMFQTFPPWLAMPSNIHCSPPDGGRWHGQAHDVLNPHDRRPRNAVLIFSTQRLHEQSGRTLRATDNNNLLLLNDLCPTLAVDAALVGAVEIVWHDIEAFSREPTWGSRCTKRP